MEARHIPLEKWDKFARIMVQAKQAWEEYQEARLSDRSTPMGIPVPVMRALASEMHRAKFEVALARLIDFWRASGGVEELVVPSNCSYYEQIKAMERAKRKTKKEEEENGKGA